MCFYNNKPIQETLILNEFYIPDISYQTKFHLTKLFLYEISTFPYTSMATGNEQRSMNQHRSNCEVSCVQPLISVFDLYQLASVVPYCVSQAD